MPLAAALLLGRTGGMLCQYKLFVEICCWKIGLNTAQLIVLEFVVNTSAVHLRCVELIIAVSSCAPHSVSGYATTASVWMVHWSKLRPFSCMYRYSGELYDTGHKAL